MVPTLTVSSMTLAQAVGADAELSVVPAARFSLPFNPCLPRPAKQPPLRVAAFRASGTHQTDRIKMIYAGL